MLKYLFIILIILQISCNKTDITGYKISNNKFKYKNLTIKIPDYFQKGIILNKWIDKNNGVTLNIEIEYSETSLNEYVKSAIKLIKKTYPDYKVLNIKNLEKNKILILSTTKFDNIMLNFYMLVVSFDNSKLIVTIAGKKNLFELKKYEDFIMSIKVNGDNKNGNNN
jgi:hypothetical protein